MHMKLRLSLACVVAGLALFAAGTAYKRGAAAQVFGSNQVYTPQMIVDGRTEFVGSSEGRARQAILQEAQAPKAAVHLRWAPIPSGQPRDLAAAKSAALGIPLDVRVEQLGETATGDTPEVYLAITESNLHSEVLRGENAGSRFDHFAVVRELRPIGTASPQAATAFSAQQVVRLAPTWKRENLRAVVFVQERHSRRVIGAAAHALLVRRGNGVYLRGARRRSRISGRPQGSHHGTPGPQGSLPHCRHHRLCLSATARMALPGCLRHPWVAALGARPRPWWHACPHAR